MHLYKNWFWSVISCKKENLFDNFNWYDTNFYEKSFTIHEIFLNQIFPNYGIKLTVIWYNMCKAFLVSLRTIYLIIVELVYVEIKERYWKWFNFHSFTVCNAMFTFTTPGISEIHLVPPLLLGVCVCVRACVCVRTTICLTAQALLQLCG